MLGAVVCWWTISPEPSDPSRLNRSLWVFLSAHMVSLGPIKSGAVVRNFERLSLVASGSKPAIWHAIPLAASFIGATAMNLAMGRTTRRDYILQNSGVAAVGYIAVALLALTISNAAPSITIAALILGGGLLALTVGSSLVGQATRRGGGVPVFGITSLGTLALIGGVALIIGFVVVRILLPIALVAGFGAILASGLVYGTRNYSI